MYWRVRCVCVPRKSREGMCTSVLGPIARRPAVYVVCDPRSRGWAQGYGQVSVQCVFAERQTIRVCESH